MESPSIQIYYYYCYYLKLSVVLIIQEMHEPVFLCRILGNVLFLTVIKLIRHNVTRRHVMAVGVHVVRDMRTEPICGRRQVHRQLLCQSV